MTRFELRTSGVVIGRSTNLATTTAQQSIVFTIQTYQTYCSIMSGLIFTINIYKNGNPT